MMTSDLPQPALTSRRRPSASAAGRSSAVSQVVVHTDLGVFTVAFAAGGLIRAVHLLSVGSDVDHVSSEGDGVAVGTECRPTHGRAWSGDHADMEQPLPTAEAAVAAQVVAQLIEYGRGERTAFDLPLAQFGTPFQQQVWAELRRIPFGQTRTYAQVAAAIGRPAAVRAVGAANGQNPIAVIVPCHRVIGASGQLVGYAGGLELKRRLLEHERRVSGRS